MYEISWQKIMFQILYIALHFAILTFNNLVLNIFIYFYLFFFFLLIHILPFDICYIVIVRHFYFSTFFFRHYVSLTFQSIQFCICSALKKTRQISDHIAPSKGCHCIYVPLRIEWSNSKIFKNFIRFFK